jgi:hypothetical protein
MSLPTQNAVRIATPSTAGPLSKTRKQFNTLVKKLEAERARLALWRVEVPKIRAQADSELSPLMQLLDAHRRQLVIVLDQAWPDKSLTKTDRKKLSDIIASTAVELLEEGPEDEAIEAIYRRHGGEVLDDDEALASMREMLAAVTGLELDDDADLSSPQAVFEAFQKKMADHQDEAEHEHARPGKPARPNAREARKQVEASHLKQSVREIFRKLASALHPDRETDPAERLRKTELMQRANVAYKANDLLGLLELQLAVEQIDQAGLDNLPDDRIKQYNRILEDQVDQVKHELDAMEAALSFEMGWDFGRRPTTKTMEITLRADVARLKTHVRHIEADLATFGDIKKLKAWLKTYRIPQPDPDFGEFFF